MGAQKGRPERGVGAGRAAAAGRVQSRTGGAQEIRRRDRRGVAGVATRRFAAARHAVKGRLAARRQRQR